QRPTHAAALSFGRELKLTPFGRGITPLQFANNLAILGIVQPPSIHSISQFLARDGSGKGCVAGLRALGFCIPAPSDMNADRRAQWSEPAFRAVYEHLCQGLGSTSDTQTLVVNVIAVEHILCKVSRW
ncbi:hypothetical protein PENSPDRAFT_542054, partial [Peniophora sp. CONT]